MQAKIAVPVFNNLGDVIEGEEAGAAKIESLLTVAQIDDSIICDGSVAPQNPTEEPARLLAADAVPQIDPATLQRELESEKQSAREIGYAEGRDAARAEVLAAAEEQMRSFDELAASVRRGFSEQLDHLEDTVVELAFEAVCKFLGHRMEVEGAVNIVRAVIAHVKEHEEFIVRVSPNDHLLITEHASNFVSALRERKCEIVSDERVKLGGCMVEMRGGTLDGRLETQLQQFREILLATRMTQDE